MVKLDVAAGRFLGMCTKRLGTKAAFVSKPVCTQRKKEQGFCQQCDEDHKKISVARDAHENWKIIKGVCVCVCVCVCVFLGHGLRSTSFVFGDANKSGVSPFSFIFLA